MRIKNGTVYDPLNNVKGEKMDIFVEDGEIVEESEEGDEIDASGLLVLPGGVDIHSHIAGGKVNAGRSFRPEDHRKDPVPKTDVKRSGVGYSVPTTFVTGYRYAKLGYTTVMEAAMPPMSAKHTHEELNHTPMLDSGAYTLMGTNHFVMKYLKDDFEKFKNFVAWLLEATGGYAIKLVNPGGGENWKWGRDVDSIDQKVDNYDVTPREIISALARANEELDLPHPIHLHCNNLGQPGNMDTLVETGEGFAENLGTPGNSRATKEAMDTVGDRLHITHVQFNAYGGESWADLASGAEGVAKFVRKNDNISLDLGQVVFDDTTTMTADGPWQRRLYRISGNKWNSHDIESEVGSGIVPYQFKKSNPVNAVQWTIGLEVALMVGDPWRVIPTTDHPNAGLFYHYPKVFSWLMDMDKRNQVLEEISDAASARSGLGGLEKEYTLNEIVIATRAAPAKRLGIEERKGHLGVGADADIAIYDYDENNIEESFSRAKYVIKDGDIVVKDGEIVREKPGKRLWVETSGEMTDEIRDEISNYYTITPNNYSVGEDYIPNRSVLTCG